MSQTIVAETNIVKPVKTVSENRRDAELALVDKYRVLSGSASRDEPHSKEGKSSKNAQQNSPKTLLKEETEQKKPVETKEPPVETKKPPAETAKGPVTQPRVQESSKEHPLKQGSVMCETLSQVKNLKYARRKIEN